MSNDLTEFKSALLGSIFLFLLVPRLNTILLRHVEYLPAADAESLTPKRTFTYLAHSKPLRTIL